MSKVDIILDATMLDTLESCACKFDYRFNKMRTTLDLAKPLDRGSMVHKGMEAYYKSLSEGLDFPDRIEKMMTEVDVYCASESDLDSEEQRNTKNILIENLTVWRNLDERMRVHAVEQSFAYLLHEDDNIRVIMIGKIDLLCDYNDGRTVYENVPFDHKSYSTMNSRVRRLNNQFTNYAMATESNFLFVNRIGFQKTVNPVEKHKRVILSFDQVFFEQWKNNIIEIAYRYLDYTARDKWPMNLTSCDKYNRDCEYLEVCDTSGIEGKVWKLEANFARAEPWDVSKSLGKKDE